MRVKMLSPTLFMATAGVANVPGLINKYQKVFQVGPEEQPAESLPADRIREEFS